MIHCELELGRETSLRADLIARFPDLRKFGRVRRRKPIGRPLALLLSHRTRSTDPHTMQTAPRLVRTAARQVVRAPGLTATSSSSSSPLYSLHSHHTAATAAAAGPLSSRFPTSHVRALSSTARAEAKEPGQDPFASEKFASDHAPLFQRIQEHPEVLDAIESEHSRCLRRGIHRTKTDSFERFVPTRRHGPDNPRKDGRRPLCRPEAVHDDDAAARTVSPATARVNLSQSLTLLGTDLFAPSPLFCDRDPDLRAASERLMTALRAAGVEFNPAEAFQALQQMGGAGFEKMADKGLEAYHEKVRKGEEDGEGGEGKNKK